MNKPQTARLGAIVVVVVAAALAYTAGAHDEKHPKPADPAKQVTIVGELIDSACFVSSGGDAKGDGHAECARKCLASGIPAAVLPEGSERAADLMFLLTNPVVLAPYAGQTVRVEGIAHREMRAIEVKRLLVRNGDGWKEVPLKDAHRDSSDDGHGTHQSRPHSGENDRPRDHGGGHGSAPRHPQPDQGQVHHGQGACHCH